MLALQLRPPKAILAEFRAQKKNSKAAQNGLGPRSPWAEQAKAASIKKVAANLETEEMQQEQDTDAREAIITTFKAQKFQTLGDALVTHETSQLQLHGEMLIDVNGNFIDLYGNQNIG